MEQSAQTPSQSPSHNRQRGTRLTMRCAGNMSPQASNPCGKVKLLAAARIAQIMNFAPVEICDVTVTRAATRKSAGRKEGNPDAKIQSSTCASEKMESTMSQKQIATATRPSPARRKRRNKPAALSKQLTTEIII